MFISHAQNFEDVILWRALKHVQHGFYIDVGAAWPDQDSVTIAFYERGWSGINIEPEPSLWRLLASSRPRDINLQLALSDRPGGRDLFVVEGTGLTTLNSDLASAHAAKGMKVRREAAQAATLSDVWSTWVGTRDVHLLKVDVEGAEAEVLQGNDWLKNRPWILVIEATNPMSRVETHATWEPLILGSGYELAYSDGVNRFYLAAEHRELLPAFSAPPNAFDGFVTARQIDAERRALRANAESRALTIQLHKAALRIEKIKSGPTWKTVKFLRKLVRFRWLTGKSRKARPAGGGAAPGHTATAAADAGPAGILEKRLLNTLSYLHRAKSR